MTATVEATEEAILNALTGATTVTGRDGFRAEAISIPRLRELLSAGATPGPNSPPSPRLSRRYLAFARPHGYSPGLSVRHPEGYG